MTTVKILVLVVSHKQNEKYWDQILSRGVDNTIMVCGDKLDTNYSLVNQVLYVNCNDGYGGLPEKMIYAYNAILAIDKFRDITHVLKVDDHDTMFTKDNIERLEKNGVSLLSNHHYIGQHIYSRAEGGHHLGKCPESRWNNRLYVGANACFAAGGFSYILDKTALEMITNEYSFSDIDKIRESHIYEDLMIAVILKKNDIIPTKAYYGIESIDPKYRCGVPDDIRKNFMNLPL